MDHVCNNCGALLGVGNVFCVNCGTPVTISIEAEQETVIRPAASPSAKPKASATSAAVGILVLAVGGIFMLFYGLDGKRPLDNSTNAAAANAAARAIIDAGPSETPAANRPMTKAEAPRTTAPTATPIDVDKMRQAIDERLRQNAANAAANAARRTANTPFVRIDPPTEYYRPAWANTNASRTPNVFTVPVPEDRPPRLRKTPDRRPGTYILPSNKP